jgi:hypothetical protein
MLLAPTGIVGSLLKLRPLIKRTFSRKTPSAEPPAEVPVAAG